jgi:hypothetical protein
VVEYLPSKHKVLSSNFYSAKKKKKNQNKTDIKSLGNKRGKPGVVVHTCNPSYLGGRAGSGGSWFEASWAERF